VASNNIKLRKQ